MIPKISRGKDPGGLMDYLLLDPGKTNEHTNQHVITSSIGAPVGRQLGREEVHQIAADLQAPQDAWEVDVSEGHIWQCSLSIKASEGALPDTKWKDISEDFLQGLGMKDDLRWVSVHHGVSAEGNDHVHIAASVIKEDGSVANTWNDYYWSQQVCADLEHHHGLEPLERRGIRALDRADLKHHGEPERNLLERQVRAAAAVAATDSEFFHELEVSGLQVRPYVQAGQITGYSVSGPGKNSRRYAGGKLARDLSLPRLQLVWKSSSSTKPTHIRAVQELQDLQRSLPTASPAQLEDASHQLAGALAAVSVATEKPAGELAAASKQAGAYAQTVRVSSRPRPAALSIGLLFLQATDPGGPAGKSVMIMQLTAAYRALLDAQFARRGLVTTRERIPSMAGQAGPEEEMVEIGVTAGLTTGALLMERHARKKEHAANAPKKKDPDLWDASDIRKFRQQDKAARVAANLAERPTGLPVTPAQLARADALATQLDMPSVQTLVGSMTEASAEKYLSQMEGAAGQPVAPQPVRQEPVVLPAEQFEAQMESKHGEKIPVPAPELSRPETWKSGDVPATELQVLWLTGKGGLSMEEARKMTKAGASSYRNSMENSARLTQAPKTQKPPPRAPGRGK